MKMVFKIDVHGESIVDDEVLKIIKNMTEEDVNDKLKEIENDIIEDLNGIIDEENTIIIKKDIKVFMED